MFEPTETESKATLDQFAKDFVEVLKIDMKPYTKRQLPRQFAELMKYMPLEISV